MASTNKADNQPKWLLFSDFWFNFKNEWSHDYISSIFKKLVSGFFGKMQGPKKCVRHS